jgi:hypothetical protein
VILTYGPALCPGLVAVLIFASAREVIEQVLLGLTKLTPAAAGVLMRRGVG